MMDRDSNRHRGFGFINLVTGDDAESLLRCGPFVMDGHPLEVKKKAPSRARFDSRDDLAKMAPAPLDRYGVPYAGPAHHEPPPFHPAPMAGYFKPGMTGPNWKGWNPSMVQPMAGGPNRGLYMGMGIPHDDRGLGPARGMMHDVPGSMVGAYGGAYHRSPSSGYGHDWRAGPPGMRAAAPGAFPPYHQHANPPSSGGPSRNQRGPRSYAPY